MYIGAEAGGSKWQKRKLALQLLQEELGQQWGLHAEAALQQHISIEREKVLCDMLLHAEFLQHWMEAAHMHSAAGRARPSSCKQTVAGTESAQDGQQEAGPESYVTHLLQQSTPAQVQHILQLAPQDWAAWLSSSFAELLAGLEVWSRCDYLDSAGGSSDGSCSTAYRANHLDGSSPAESPEPAGGGGGGASTAAHSSRPAQLQDAAPACWQQPEAGMQHQDQQQAQAQLQLEPGLGWHMRLGADSPAALLHAVDGCMRQLLLGCVLSFARMMQAEGVLTARGGQQAAAGEAAEGAGGSSMRKWQGVADRLQLTEMQRLHLSICMAELQRMEGSTDAAQLLELALQPTTQLAAALQQQAAIIGAVPSGAMPGAPACLSSADAAQAKGFSSKPAPPKLKRRQSDVPKPSSQPGPEHAQQGAPAPAARQLQQYLTRRHAHMLAAQACIINTLSRQQLAVLVVGSYPQCPDVLAVAEVVRRRVGLQQQRWLCRMRQGDGLASAGQPPAAALGCAALASGSTAGGLLHGMGGAGQMLMPADGGIPGCDAAAAAAGLAYDSLGAAAVHSRGTFTQRCLWQHEAVRAAQLLHHQALCWARADVQEEVRRHHG